MDFKSIGHKAQAVANNGPTALVLVAKLGVQALVGIGLQLVQLNETMSALAAPAEEE